MNSTIKAAPADSSSPVMGTLAIMGFAAEVNLRSVAQALGKGDPRDLGLVAERNAKQPRLRAEIEEQIARERASSSLGTPESNRWMLASRAASIFESMGNETVEIARLGDEVLRQPQPGRFADIRKLLEHAVYITDRAVTGLVEEDLKMPKAALEQKRAALELSARVERDLGRLATESGRGARVELLRQVAGKARDLIEEAGRFAGEVVAHLESALVKAPTLKKISVSGV